MHKGAASLPEGNLHAVRNFVEGLQHPYGGFLGHHNLADPFYTFFGLRCSSALDIPIHWDKMRNFLLRYETGQELDLTHLICLAQSWKIIQHHFSNSKQEDSFSTKNFLSALIPFAAKQGGYNRVPDTQRGLLFETFLVIATLKDYGLELPDQQIIHTLLSELHAQDGSYANHRGLREGTATVTAAAIHLLLLYGFKDEATQAGQWLLTHFHESGGIRNHSISGMPDLFSTAFALLALHELGIPMDETWRYNTIQFIYSLRDRNGGFRGHLVDQRGDLEYTAYALIVLGILEK